MVRTGWRPAFLDNHLVAMVVTGTIEPGVWHLARDTNYQGVAFPMRIGMTHPGIDLRFQFRLIHVKDAVGFCNFIGNQDDFP